MGQQFFSKARTLSRRDVLDLIRAGLVLAMTVGMALAVPPRVFAAVEGTADHHHVEATR